MPIGTMGKETRPVRMMRWRRKRDQRSAAEHRLEAAVGSERCRSRAGQRPVLLRRSWRSVVAETPTGPVDRADLQIRNLLDDPGLRRAMGLSPAGVTAIDGAADRRSVLHAEAA